LYFIFFVKNKHIIYDFNHKNFHFSTYIVDKCLNLCRTRQHMKHCTKKINDIPSNKSTWRLLDNKYLWQKGIGNVAYWSDETEQTTTIKPVWVNLLVIMKVTRCCEVSKHPCHGPRRNNHNAWPKQSWQRMNAGWRVSTPDWGSGLRFAYTGDEKDGQDRRGATRCCGLKVIAEIHPRHRKYVHQVACSLQKITGIGAT